MDTLPEIPAPRAPQPEPDFAALDEALNGAATAVADLRRHVETLQRHFENQAEPRARIEANRQAFDADLIAKQRAELIEAFDVDCDGFTTQEAAIILCAPECADHLGDRLKAMGFYARDVPWSNGNGCGLEQRWFDKAQAEAAS
ncbi:hypothetical protein G5C33_09360 [Sphingosinithalassobacter tenebrarum]|uniref:Uncharacterized protein n=2 Tax=Stakelama tenebrarum TaxID=2711215 RepID=A0A6G6Y536_9SPHN|nr:hypothetical protein G5C33_09360 [Sphingosinithalassobacter tenebrarum]